MSLAPPLSSRRSPHPGPARRRRLGYAGLGWALSYLPIHLYWATGGGAGWLGVTRSGPDWRAANWGAAVVIAGAGLTCLALTERWGDVLPRALRHGTAWVGGVLGIAHWAVFSVLCALRLAGLLDYPPGTELAQLHRFDWANLLYFEPWFGVMGALLITCSRRAMRRDRASSTMSATPTSTWRRIGSALTVAGVAVVVWGVFTLDPRVFAGYGPALLAIGLLILVVSAAGSRSVR